MKKILFPTEFSPHAAEVFKYAADLAYFFKARLVLMHAFKKPDLTIVRDDELVEMAEITSNELIDFVDAHLPPAYEKLKIEYITQTGMPAESILETAQEENIDLIVMGMTGKTNALNRIFGSTALDVLSKADCPVLTVPAAAKFKGIDNIIYVTTFQFRDLSGINYMRKWRKAFEASLHCVHVAKNSEEELAGMKNMYTLKETYNSKNIYGAVMKGEFQKEIEKFTKAKDADIIVLMSHKSSFVGKLVEKNNVVNKLAMHTRIPLLVLKDNLKTLGIPESKKTHKDGVIEEKD